MTVQPATPHPLGWSQGPFPPRRINNPPVEVEGLWTGVCVFCGGSLGGPYDQDLYHMECEKAAESKDSNATRQWQKKLLPTLTTDGGKFPAALVIAL